jgi:methionyl-tRNA synthetase
MTIDEFRQVDLRVAKVLAAERVEGSEKLVRLTVDAGDKDVATLPAGRQVVAGIGKAYTPEALIGKEIVVVANLEPRVFTLRSDSGQVGIESRGMLLAASDENGTPVILTVEKDVPPGAKVT